MAKTNTKELTLEQALEQLAAKENALNGFAKENKQLIADLKEKDLIIAEIRSAGNNKTVAEAPTFEYNGKTYKVVIPRFRVGTEVLTAEDLCQNVSLQKELIDGSSSIVEEVIEN